MPDDYRARTFRSAQIVALDGLLDALREERIPVHAPRGLTTGKIAEYLDERYLPLQPRTMLSVLREVGVPHDSKHRFLTWNLYAHQDQLQELSERWFYERVTPLPFELKVEGSRQSDTGDDPEPEAISQ